MIPLETPRLVLREVDQDDWPAVHAYASDPQVVRFVAWGPNTEEETRARIQRTLAQQGQVPRALYSLAVILREENQLVGGVALRLSNPQNRGGYMGYVFNRHYWGNGYGTEAARELLAFGFGALDLHRIHATCDPRNVASRRVLEKIGMRREGHLREHKWQKGRWRDSFVYAMLEHEWSPPTPLAAR